MVREGDPKDGSGRAGETAAEFPFHIKKHGKGAFSLCAVRIGDFRQRFATPLNLVATQFVGQDATCQQTSTRTQHVLLRDTST